VPARRAGLGASIGYQVLAAFPEVVRSAVVMAVPHPAANRESLLRADDFAFVDWLWNYWTAPGFTDTEHLAEVKPMAVTGLILDWFARS
jgi:pimeloyl-ACP methyl ester carboxylesterase